MSLKDWDNLFPVVSEADSRHHAPPKSTTTMTQEYVHELWQQLDHLGNAGFDPDKFRVDCYGNVLYWNADPSSPLAWEVDHWFPHARGGRTVVGNLRIMQWQAYQKKKHRLEFLVPWWDLQHGVSINQFLSAFVSKNAEFRRRSFALFFAGGEDENVVREHLQGDFGRPSWPPHFRERKVQCGLAAAAIDSFLAQQADERTTQQPNSSQSGEGEEALKKQVANRFDSGSCKEIKEQELAAVAHRSTAQIKDKLHSMKGDRQPGKENLVNPQLEANRRMDRLDRQSVVTTALQKELRVKIMREEEKREKEEELVELEETVLTLKQQNEKAKRALSKLENVVSQQRRHVEKQRKLAETQFSYRICLERMIRDTMHQSISYKEQARLNQAACNALMAQLECQKSACETAERDLLQRYTEREKLGAKLNPDVAQMVKNHHPVMRGRDIVDLSSCVSPLATDEENDVVEAIVPADGVSETDSEDKKADHDQVYCLQLEVNHPSAGFLQQNKQRLLHKCPVVHPNTEELLLPECGVKEVVAASQLAAVRQDIRPLVKEKTESPDAPPLPQKGTLSDGCAEELEKESDDDNQLTDTSEEEGESDFADDEMSCELCENHETCTYTDAEIVEVQTEMIQQMAAKQEVTPQGKNKEIDLDENLVAGGHDNGAAAATTSGGPVFHCLEEHLTNLVPNHVAREVGSQETATTCSPHCDLKHVDELPREIRYEVLETGVAEDERDDDDNTDPHYKQEERLDELLHEVLTTHVERIRRNEASAHYSSPNIDDEKICELGKSNLDKWLQALLHEAESAGSSPTHGSPLHIALSSPAQSPHSMAAMHMSTELESKCDQDLLKRVRDDSMEMRKGFWGGLLRKKSVKHPSEQSPPNQLEGESDNVFPLPPVQRHPEEDPHTAINSLAKVTSDGFYLDELRTSSKANGRLWLPGSTTSIPESVENWPDGSRLDKQGAADYCDNKSRLKLAKNFYDTTTVQLSKEEKEIAAYMLDNHIYIGSLPRSLSNVDEVTETESLSSNNPDFQMLEEKDLSKSGLRASIKAATLVWRKAVKKLESKLQDELAGPPAPHMD
ncbi:hypothetical protein CY35_19G032400 [Sphagnum magellanicum]|nr:hypothetical protein CY35_19G032400 [Sphagnum magellanicum]